MWYIGQISVRRDWEQGDPEASVQIQMQRNQRQEQGGVQGNGKGQMRSTLKENWKHELIK